MAQLPPDGEWLMQQIGDRVILFNRYTELELVSFGLHGPDGRLDAGEIAKVQQRIRDLDELTDEQKSFAHFWSGYFYAHAMGIEPDPARRLDTFPAGS